jgi:hypothetical protein
MTSAETIARARGGFRAGKWWRCPCPAHQSTQASLALRDGRYALIVICHAGCSRRDILEELRRLGLLDGRYQPAPLPDQTKAAADALRMRAYARSLWERARLGPGSPIEAWFKTRGIDLPVPSALRWLPQCPHPSKLSCAAMVARVENVDGELLGIRRTFLTADGQAKAAVDPVRASLGPVASGAVRLAPLNGQFLFVGEGVETALTGIWATGLPGWAAGDTSGLRNLILPSAVRSVVILGERDANGASLKAARAAAERWRGEGRRVRLAWPEAGYNDINDMAQPGATHVQ